MTPQQIEQAQNMARECQKRNLRGAIEAPIIAISLIGAALKGN